MVALKKRFRIWWRGRSIRFWFVAGMGLSLAPVAASAIVGYALLNQRVIHPFDNVVARQEAVLEPVQELRLKLWEAAMPVNDYLILASAEEVETYRRMETEVEAAFQSLNRAVDRYGGPADLIEKAYGHWGEAAEVAETIITLDQPIGNAPAGARMEEFDRLIELASAALAQFFQEVHGGIHQDRDRAIQAHSQAEIMAAGAFLVSLAFVGLGVLLINRVLLANINRLVMGAMRLAVGDREHQVDIAAPPELRKVAISFNFMMDRIKDQEEELAEAARTDTLTGLFNRREFNRILHEEITRGQRYGTLTALAMIDIDRFKALNDSHGHHVGDRALRAVADRIRGNIRETDKAFRYGGEEFAIILPNTEAADAYRLAERLRRTIASSPIELEEGEPVRLTVSIGLAGYPTCGRTPDAVLQAADRALYQSKSAGRNQLRLAPSFPSSAEFAT